MVERLLWMFLEEGPCGSVHLDSMVAPTVRGCP